MMLKSGNVAKGLNSGRASRTTRSVVVRAERALWAPGVAPPSWLDGSLPGDRGFDPAGLGADPKALAWHRQAELVHARWAMLGAAGVLGQEILNPNVNWYTEAALPQNLPAPFTNVNLGGLLAIEFLLMHWVEVRRWQDIRKFGSVNQDPIFKGNSVPNLEPGYPGGIFDPLGFSKGNLKELQTKEIKNGRLAMIAWIGFAFQAQTTGKGPLASLSGHLSDPAGDNWLTNIGTCAIPKVVDVQGLSIPTTCLWPAAN
ncbi:Chlorophyll a-b binding protein [Monoraphidium neglectum]|uniref:Chlorophyll a-b binding protein, chloroplastic n=1 Tax=Monoraphidium neglectum TaxID=145388 RepID=A0A0D2L7I1_9CHLO|nr:Chlorophyll a-b binding protein [Monoraphidium neglectum]KIZ02809.1 Chlorophyll a-b binding protein [Monoraphidium neglectum]|eukprot:XP_013901828.1 Chlorophyll a-b binding protein [Monoraphidium neglectum]